MLVLLTAYTLMSLLRYQIGADWFAYEQMYALARSGSLAEALTITDPLFSFVMWFSGLIGTGVYLGNAVASFLLCLGVIQVSRGLREPWLGVTVAVPYIMIVVGFGYVRQAAAIGLVLMAISSLERGRPLATIIRLLCAVGFHSTSVVAIPMFGLALANRNRLRLLLLGLVGSFAVLAVAAEHLSRFEENYLEAAYQSGGALVRLLLNFLCSVLLLVRWRKVQGAERTRSLWLGIAMANVLAGAAFLLTPSSTAVDRVSLYFAIIQIYVFGNIAEIMGASQRAGVMLRFLVIGIAVAVQVVWLFFATHAEFWVPYRSILSFF
jgi:hypothetical protein